MHSFLKRFLPDTLADLLTGVCYAALLLLSAILVVGDQPAFRYISL